jgi:hypothetical protein
MTAVPEGYKPLLIDLLARGGVMPDFTDGYCTDPAHVADLGRGNPDPWFPGIKSQENVDHAREVCAGCPLLEDGSCLEYALAVKPEHGIWAATTPGMRRQILRKRRTRQRKAESA